MSSVEPTLAIQKALRSRLIASPAVTALVPVGNVALDARRPEAMPCIVIGPANVSFGDNFDQFFDEVFCDIHLWSNESGISSLKPIAAAIRGAVESGQWIVEGHNAIRVTMANARYLRDPDGIHVHGVLSIEAILKANS